MDVTVTYSLTGVSCVVEIEGEATVFDLKEKAIASLFADTIDATLHTTQGTLSASLESGTDSPLPLSDETRIRDTPLEAGCGVTLSPIPPTLTRHWYGHKQTSCVAMSPCGRIFAAGHAGHQHRGTSIWDAVTQERMQYIDMPDTTSLAFSPCGRWLAAAAGGAGLLVYNTTAWQVSHRLRHATPPTTVSWSTAGIVCTSEGDVYVWAMPQAQRLHLLRADGAAASAVAAVGDVVAAVGESLQLRVWGIQAEADARCLHTAVVAAGDSKRGLSVALAWDASLAVVGCADGAVRVWDLHAFACLRVLQCPDSAPQYVWDVCVSLEHDVAAAKAVLGDDLHLQIWQLSTGESLHSNTACEETGELRGLDISPCGRYLLVGTEGVGVHPVETSE